MIVKSGLLPLLVLLAACTTREQKEKPWALAPFIKTDSVNPILSAGTSRFLCPFRQQTVLWDEKDVFNPAAVV